MEEEMQIHLNEYQRAAVLDESPACVVNANVGSGKTTVLIEKILYLHLERQVPLEQMVVLTFTNKAADEITERLLQRVPCLATEQVQGFGTFHSVALRLLKNRLPVEGAGWTKAFTVMDPDEETDLALDIITENRLKKRLEQERQAYLSGNTESRYKDDLFRLYPLLEGEKRRQNKMSFADLLEVCTELLRTEKKAETEAWRPAWIIVDEVQDSNLLQLDLLEALRDYGDPNQVIYSWRGTGENMFFLLKHRFGAKELSLPVNYRSSASILEAANRFLQFGSGIQGSRTDVSRITVKNHYDPFQEAEYLAERIRVRHEEGKPYSEIAVFYRLQRQSETLMKVFDRQGIPFELSVKKTIKEIPVLNWIVKVLRFSVNSSDYQTAVQVLTDKQYGEKCTKKKAEHIIMEDTVPRDTGGAGGASVLYSRMKRFAEDFRGASAAELFEYFGLREALHPTSAGYAEDERLVLEFLEKMCVSCSRGDAGEIRNVSQKGASETGAAKIPKDSRKDGVEVCFADAVREFINSSALYGMQADAGEKTGDEESRERREAPDRVKLMTLHASKGLEFDTVFIIGVNQGLIPLQCRSFEQEEEERRLFFVGITRAKNSLELSWYTNPGEPGVLGEPGRYLRMIPEQVLERGDRKSPEERRSDLQRMGRQVREQIRKKEESVREVLRVRHRKYGEGVLVAEDEMTVTAEFEGYGRKQFLKALNEVEILRHRESASPVQKDIRP